MLRRIRWEILFLIAMVPVAVIQFVKAAPGFKLLSIIMSITLYGGFALIIYMIRKGE